MRESAAWRVAGTAARTGAVVVLLAAGFAGAVHAEAAKIGSEAAAEILARHPEESVARLMREKTLILDPPVPRQEGGAIEALVVFEQPRSRTLLLLSQTARQSEYRPELRHVETVERTEGGTIDEHQMRIMFMKIDYRVRTHYDYDAGRITWQLDPRFANDLQEVEGFWELYELDEKRTLGRFGTRVNVGPAMPIWLQDYATRKNLPQTMDRMRRWVDSDGTYRP